MKITSEHYNFLKTQISKLPRDSVMAHKALNLGGDKQKRFRWDLLYATQMPNWISDNLYSYLTDIHIDTALKRIVTELEFD